MHPWVTAVQVIAPYDLYLAFEDGTSGKVDARSRVENSPGIFAELRDPAEFAKVCQSRIRYDRMAERLGWSACLDLD